MDTLNLDGLKAKHQFAAKRDCRNLAGKAKIKKDVVKRAGDRIMHNTLMKKQCRCNEVSIQIELEEVLLEINYDLMDLMNQ